MSLQRRHVLAGSAALTLLAFLWADLSGPAPDPWLTLRQIGWGLMHPSLPSLPALTHAAALTVAFALCGVALGAGAGLLLAPLYQFAPVRWLCVSVRAVHELFWALLLLNITGLSPATGILAIGLPYAGIFAKVFAEYLEEASPAPSRALPRATGQITRLLWANLPQCLPQMRSYTLYRVECGMRSSAVLGFIGLPTLGFQLETYFRQAHYDQAIVVLAVFFALILPLRYWLHWRLALLFILAGAALLAAQPVPPMADGAWLRFFQDIVPAPIRLDQPVLPWLEKVLIGQAWPGAVNTLVLSQIALALSALLAAVAFPMIVPRVAGRFGAALGHGLLVLVRSTPEYMLAFVLLQVFGPSMLPAILALGLHNGAIIAHLMGRHASTLTLRHDAPRGLTLWGWELFPRLSGSFWALCLYRWEIIIRESAIMGILGITTLGFYVQRNVQELRLDRVVLLLLVTIGITLAVDHLSRRLRRTMRLGNDLRIETSRGQWRT